MWVDQVKRDDIVPGTSSFQQIELRVTPRKYVINGHRHRIPARLVSYVLVFRKSEHTKSNDALLFNESQLYEKIPSTGTESK